MAASSAAFSLAALPDELLVSVFGCLSLKERHRALPLVCQRFWQLVNSPQLLCSVSLHSCDMPRLRALCRWLGSRAAGAVRSLELSMQLRRHASGEAVSVLQQALVESQLEELTLIFDSCLSSSLEVSGSWLPPLRGLTSLMLSFPGPMLISAPLGALSSLRELDLYGNAAELLPAVALPPSLTRLFLCDTIEQDAPDALPNQVAALTNLRQLGLEDGGYASDGYAPLAALRSLRGLWLESVRLPANLSQLTWLESLTVVDEGELLQQDPEHGALLRAALPWLTRLRYLTLDPMAGMDSPPAALAGLSRLHTFVWRGEADAALPAGPWLGSLRRLAAPAHLLANSLHLLAAAPRLEHLFVSGGHGEPTLRILRRAARFPSLEKLSLECFSLGLEGSQLPAALFPAALEAQRQRPSLLIDLSPWPRCPEELLLSIFGCLDLEERHRALPLVCQRFWLLVNSPHLLRSVSIDDYGLPRLSALCHWLRPRAAGAVRSLSLHMRLADNHLEEELEEQQALVSSVLMACGGNMGGGVEPQLEQLDLDFGNIHLDCSLELLEVSGSWFPPLRGLTRLVLSSNVDMVVSAPLGVLSNLRELGLSGSPAQLLPAVALPPSLTRLEMMTDTPLGTAPTPLPKQVAALTNLRQLHLSWTDYGSDGYTPLTALCSLRSLRLENACSLPANLSQLTWLEALTVEDDAGRLKEGPEHGAILVSALPRLTRLAYLALSSMAGVNSPPAALAGLSRLHTLVWLDPDSPPADAVLPAGPWLASLRRLAAPAHLLANSLHLLAAAPRLEHLAVAVAEEHGEPTHTQRILRSAVRWPSLQELSLHRSFWMDGSNFAADVFPAALQAQRHRPSLCINFVEFDLRELWLDAE